MPHVSFNDRISVKFPAQQKINQTRATIEEVGVNLEEGGAVAADEVRAEHQVGRRGARLPLVAHAGA